MNAKSPQHTSDATWLSRRLVLGGLAAGSAAGLAFGQTRMPPTRDFRALSACPPNPESGIVNWIPDVLHPVSFGFREYALGQDGAPMRMRIYYPSHQPFTEGGSAPRPMLKMCNARWPLVLFLHGLPPCIDGPMDPNYFLRWTRFATVLAQSGYVVAFPSYEAPDPTDANHPTIARAMSVIDWVRGIRIDTTHPGAARAVGPLSAPRWENADWVHPRASAVVGHSFGSLLAARIAQARPNISSYVSLSGGFDFFGDPLPILQSIAARKFFMWGVSGDATDLTHENLDANGLWPSIPQPKHVAFSEPAEHFDYIRLRSASECGSRVGQCTALRELAPDLVALFIARHTPVSAPPGIPLSLIPPNVTLTPTQQFFAGDHLGSLTRFDSVRNCRMTVRWETPEGSGAR